MPLIKRGPPGAPEGERTDIAAGLSAVSEQARWSAAREAGADPSSVPQLAKALAEETSPQVREAIFTSLVRIRTEASARTAAEMMRSDDAALRSGAIDALCAMPEMTQRILPGLLADMDPDVRLLSCELARSMAPDAAMQMLVFLLKTETEVNVCGAAIDVLAEVGTLDAVGPMLACKSRFPDEAFLGFAIDDAIERAGAGRLDRNE
jgi:HEAT repeat protein